MEDCDVITWTMIIGGLAEHLCGHEALEVFNTMIADGVEPGEIVVLSACSHSGLVDEGRRHFLAMTQDYGFEPNVVLCTAWWMFLREQNTWKKQSS
jgi:pentatricopeptide repeat protein